MMICSGSSTPATWTVICRRLQTAPSLLSLPAAKVECWHISGTLTPSNLMRDRSCASTGVRKSGAAEPAELSWESYADDLDNDGPAPGASMKPVEPSCSTGTSWQGCVKLP